MRRLLTMGVLLAVVPPLAAQKNVFFQEVSWSPDSEWISYTAVATGDPWTSTIMRMRPNGKDVRPIPHGLLSARWTAWHPEGRRMAFAGEVDGNWEIFVIDLESEAVTRLTHTPAVTGFGVDVDDDDRTVQQSELLINALTEVLFNALRLFRNHGDRHVQQCPAAQQNTQGTGQHSRRSSFRVYSSRFHRFGPPGDRCLFCSVTETLGFSDSSADAN